MLRRITGACCLSILVLNFLLLSTAGAASPRTAISQNSLADFPTVDPNYIYNQLFYMVTHFQRREAGYDKSLPVSVNGHDEFAAYWSQEMLNDLQGFGPQVRRDEFSIKGFRNRPATVPAFNVEVSVPGVTHPEQVVILGCHYDGETSSTQSANDDASGCAIELGVAKAMSAYWRSHNIYPARTLRFVIFDAEEQGLWGSFHYLNSTVNGDIHNIVAMFNQEQNGIAYPLRYLGQMANAVLPLYVFMSPLENTELYPNQNKLSQQQKDSITHFSKLMQQAVPAAFAQFRAMGFQALTYHAGNNQDVPQSIFTPADIGSVSLEKDTLGSSDQEPFTLAGLPCATFVGNSTYYEPNPPPGSYPYDQPQDTIQLMNTFADGSSQQSQALTLALALPGMLTTWMLNQPDILGQAAPDINPIAAISDIGQTQVGKSISLDARASFAPKSTSSGLSYTWNFGDGTNDTGVAINHIYTAAGNYTLTLMVSSARGQRHISKLIHVVTQITSYDNPYSKYNPTGRPRSNPAVQLPTPDDSLSDKVTTETTASVTVTTRSKPTAGTGFLSGLTISIGLGILIMILVIGVIIGIMRRKRLV